MTKAAEKKQVSKKELLKRAEELGVEGVDSNFPVKAIQLLIEQAEKRIAAENTKQQKKASTARTPRQKFIELASGSVAQAARLAIDNPAYVPSKKASGTEKSMVQYTKKVLAILYRDGALTEEYRKHIENCLPNA